MKGYLQQIKKIDTQLKNKVFEERRLLELGLPVGQVLDEKERLKIEREQIIKTIERLPEAEYDVLHRVYVQGETLQEVAAERNISYSQATSIHGRALKWIKTIKDCE